jgi:hypothetical protein
MLAEVPAVGKAREVNVTWRVHNVDDCDELFPDVKIQYDLQ